MRGSGCRTRTNIEQISLIPDICGAVRRAGDDGVSYRECQQQRCRGPAVQIWQ